MPRNPVDPTSRANGVHRPPRDPGERSEAIPIRRPRSARDDANGDGELADLLGDIGTAAGYRVRLDRNDGRGEWEWLGALELTENFMEDVRAQYGGGKFKARIYDAGGKYARSLAFRIAGAPRDMTTPTPARAEPDRLDRLESALVALAAAVKESRTAPAPVDPLAQFVVFAKAMRELTPAPAAAPAAAVDPLDNLTKLLTFQTALEDRMGGVRPAANGFDVGALVRDGIRPLIGVVEKKIDSDREIMLHRRPVVVVPASTPAAPAGPRDELAELVRSLPFMARAFLAGAARDNKSAELYGEMVIDNLPGDVVDKLPELLAGDDAGDRIAAAVPEWHAFAPWFGALRLAMLAELADDDDAGDGTDAEPASV